MACESTTGEPITEREALEQATALGLHGLAFDDVQEEEDESLHWIDKDPAERSASLSI
jgi:hypothetical protein